tara:strand:- start:64 stop:186 length:123 start_codon:yes stop_codon:yes gene_type:complete
MSKKADYFVTIQGIKITVLARNRFEALEKAERKFKKFKKI